MTRKLLTAVEIGSGLADYEAEIEVEYSIYPGCGATSLTPAEEATATIKNIVVIAGGKRHAADWLCDLLADDEELLSLCLQDDAEDRIAQAEYRAEAIREERMLGDR